MSNVEIEYRPKLTFCVVVASVLIMTAGILVWLGFVLVAEDRNAMEGMTRILFTVVPIRWFSWTMAIVFVGLAVLVIRRYRQSSPTMIVAASGLKFDGMAIIPWKHIDSAKAINDQNLIVKFSADFEMNKVTKKRNGPGSWFIRRQIKSKQLSFSSYELGSDPRAVAAEITTRLESCKFESI